MKVKLQSLTKGLLFIKPNAGIQAETIMLGDGKFLEFDNENEYAKYSNACSTFIQHNPQMLKIVAKEEAKQVVKEAVKQEEVKSEVVKDETPVALEVPALVEETEESKGKRGRRRG